MDDCIVTFAKVMSAGADASVKHMRLQLNADQAQHAYDSGSRIGMPVFVTAIYQTSYKSRGLDQPSFIKDNRSISIVERTFLSLSVLKICRSPISDNRSRTTDQ
jgi:hypothetical protein